VRWRGSGSMVSKKSVQYIELGYTTAEQYWREVAWPAYERFKLAPSRQAAIEASMPAWHIHEWIWHEKNPGEDTHGNKKFRKFQKRILTDCPQLSWIRDVADASKHRGLGRQPLEIKRMSLRRRFSGAISGAPIGALPISGNGLGKLAIVLNGGSTHDLSDVLACVVGYWQGNWFAA
jgi:hypothetical protein